MRVLFVITGLAYGGAEIQLVNVAGRLKERGWKIYVVSMLPPQAFTEELGAAGIELVTLNMRRGVPDPRSLFRLANIVRRLQPHIVHSHMVHANLLARITRLLAPAPVLICTAHNTYEGGRHREVFYRLTDPLCDLTTQVSSAGLERYVSVGAVPSNKIRYIPNGIDTEKFKPNPEARQRIRDKFGLGSSFVWLAVGRFDVQKDYPNLLNAFARVTREFSNVRLIIAGDGPLRSDMEALTKTLGIDRNTSFLGICHNVSELMNAADAFVLSSRWEGFGIVIIEAMACQLPVVATDSGGPGEILNEGRLGLLVPVGDYEKLANAMIKVMNLPEAEREAMGQAGRAHVEGNFSLDRVVDRWEELYTELLRKKGVKVDDEQCTESR